MTLWFHQQIFLYIDHISVILTLNQKWKWNRKKSKTQRKKNKNLSELISSKETINLVNALFNKKNYNKRLKEIVNHCIYFFYGFSINLWFQGLGFKYYVLLFFFSILKVFQTRNQFIIVIKLIMTSKVHLLSSWVYFLCIVLNVFLLREYFALT